MNRQKDLAKNTAILTLGKVCTQCISFLLLPLYTALLDTSDYGRFDLLITYATLLLPLVTWQFGQGLFRFVLDCRNDQQMKGRVYTTVFCVNTIQSLVFAIILGILSVITKIQNPLFLGLYVVLHVYTDQLLQFARGLGKSKVYAIASFLSASLTVMANVVTLVLLGMRLDGLFAATIFSLCVTLIYLCIVLKPLKYLNVRSFDIGTYKRIYRYSLPLIPNNLAWWTVNASDRVIISHILGVAANGIYTVANKFSSVFIQFYNIFNLSWTETVSLHFNDDDRDEFLSETITTIYKLYSCACLLFVAVMPLVFSVLVDSKYNESYPQILILMYAMLFRVVVGLYSSVYAAMKNTKKIAITSALSAIINIIVNLMFISKMGLYAASLSTFVAFAVMAVIRYVDINKIIRMRIDTPVLLSSVALAIILGFTYYLGVMWVNLIVFTVICVYSLLVNRDIITIILAKAKGFIGDLFLRRK